MNRAFLLLSMTYSLLLTSPVLAQTIMVSVTPAGSPGNGMSGGGDFFSVLDGAGVAVNDNGTIVAFTTKATNLVAGTDANGAINDIVVRDLVAGTSRYASVSTLGVQGNSDALAPAVSADGRYVAFASRASNLVPLAEDPCPICMAVYVHDRVTGETRRVSVATDGSPANGDSHFPSLSADGRLVAFVSYAANLVPGDTNGSIDTFVHDRTTGVTTRVSVSTGGGQGGPFVLGPGAALNLLHSPSISADGRLVAFVSGSPGLTPVGKCWAASTQCLDVFVRDRATGTTRWAGSTQPSSLTAAQGVPRIGAGGRFVVSYGTDSYKLAIHDVLTGSSNPFPGLPGASIADQEPLMALRVADGVPFVLDYRPGGLLTEIRVALGGLPQSIKTSSIHINRTGRWVAFSLLFGLPGFAANQLYVHNPIDADGDALLDTWETAFGLNPYDPADALADPDGDGRTNVVEQAEGTHPRGLPSATRYFAEGADTSLFDTRVSLTNTTTTSAHALLRFTRPDGTFLTHQVVVPGRENRKLDVATFSGLGQTAFSTTVETDVPLVADRLMRWGSPQPYGSHVERSTVSPSLSWYFAEGATHSGFELFYLILNPGSTTADVRVRYLRSGGAPLEKSYSVPPHSRFTIWVDQESFSGTLALANADVGAVFDVQNGVPVIVERAMYLSPTTGPMFTAGHASAGVTSPSTEWFLAEGATGPYFDTFVLVTNTTATDANISVRYLLDTGLVHTKTYVVPASSRFTIWTDEEQFGALGKVLANAAFSTSVESLNAVPVAVERSMWWPGPTSATWFEAHNAFGATQGGTAWIFAEGEVRSGTDASDTYLLIANLSPFDASARVTVFYTDGRLAESRTFTIAGARRFTVDLRTQFPQTIGRGFGLSVESLGTSPALIVAERALYSDANGIRWAAGGVSLGTPP
jgi:hypothetical protein